MKVWIVLFCISTLLILFATVALIKTYQARKLNPDAVVILPLKWLWIIFAAGAILDSFAVMMFVKTQMPPITLHGGSFRSNTHRGTPDWTHTGDNINYTTAMPLNGSTTEYLTIIAASADDGSNSIAIPPISVQGDWRIDFYYDDGSGSPDMTTELRACTAYDCTLTNSSTTGVVYLEGNNSKKIGTNGEFSHFPFPLNGVQYDVNQCRESKPNCNRGRRNHFHQMVLTTLSGKPSTYYCPKGDCKVCIDTQTEDPALDCD